MASPLLRVLLAILVSVSLFHSLEAQGRRGPRGKIKVLIEVRPDYAETSSIHVQLISIQGENIDHVVLVGERSCVFENVSRGDYVLTVESEGFRTAEHNFNFSPYNRIDEVLISLTLHWKEADESLRSGGTVTVRELSIPTKAAKELEKAEKESANGRTAKAIEHLRKAIEIYPEYHQAFNNLAVEYLKLGQVEDARMALLEAIGIDPKVAKTHRNLAELYISQGHYEQALQELDTAEGIEPHNARSLKLAGEVYRGLGHCELAIPFFLTALALDSEQHSYLGLADCYIQNNLIAEARAELSAFVERFPADPRVDAIKMALGELDSRLASSR